MSIFTSSFTITPRDYQIPLGLKDAEAIGREQ
jgi:hypothetical protein